MTQRAFIASIGAATVTVCAANADPVQITSLVNEGIKFTINSGELPGFGFGNGGEGDNTFSNAALLDLHQTLAADGVSTDGLVTFLAADTTQGLTFFTLIDREFTGEVGGETDSSIDLSSVISQGADAEAWINDSDSDPFDFGEILKTVEVAFSWDSDDNGDALAWSGLVKNDSGSLSFANYNGMGIDDGFQFVTFENGEWQSAAMFKAPDDINQSFDFIVIPLPGVAAMGAVGLAGLGLTTRRRPMA